MSEIKVNKISPRTACGTTTLGDSGDTFTLPSGTTMTVASGATITNSGTASGFGATGETSWDTTVKTTGTFTATAGVGYFLNTTGGVITVNLPAGAAGSSVALADYAGTWQTSNVTVSPNGSEKMGGVNADIILSTEGQAVTFVYIDAVQGWVNVLDSTSNVRGATFVAATGGNAIVTNGDYKTHIFTGPGTFCVSAISTVSADNKVDYFVVAGGGGGYGGGGGAGGFRVFSTAPGSNSPLNNSGASPNTEITVSVTGYPITVGGGGAGSPGSPSYCGPAAVAGTVSTFSTVTSAGGGRAGAFAPSGAPACGTGGPGGSGGGGGYLQSGGATVPGGTGNTPPVSPPQGSNGGSGRHAPGSWALGGGSGGAGGSGVDGAPGGPSAGGIGSYIADSFVGPTAPSYGTPGPVSSTRYFAGGGSAGPGSAGSGGGGPGSPPRDATVNTGGGAGGSTPTGSGGSGIVMIRYKFQ
jgi:hypothetical protein